MSRYSTNQVGSGNDGNYMTISHVPILREPQQVTIERLF